MKWMPILFLLVVAVALGLRLPHLADRPMHHDEANQAVRFGALLEEGTYAYDAGDHHGPTLYYLTLPIAWLTGAKTFAETTETTYRILPAICGMLLILCTPLLRSGIGCIAVLSASLFTAISPAMAYYSRFYIQEMSLVFFSFLTIAAGWHAWQNGSRSWAVVCGLSAGLMFATKETAIIAYAAMLGSGVLCVLLRRSDALIAFSSAGQRDEGVASTIRATRASRLRLLLMAAGCTVLVSYVLFSSFFTNPSGPLESLLAFKGYVSRGTGVETDHVHPWNFYLKMLTFYRFDGGPVWSEGLVFGLGLLGCVCILLKKIPANCNLGLARFLMFYTLLLTVAYSAIAYKTPWCILSFLHGWILLAGIGVAALADLAQRGWKPRLQSGILFVLLLVPVIGTARLAQRTVFRYAADERNPYVYAHTAPDFMHLVRRIGEIEAVAPAGKGMYIQVVADPKQTWPLPFYLRAFPNTGYWIDPDNVPVDPKPDIIISAPSFETAPDDYLTEYYGLRPDTLLAIHIRSILWNTFLETRK
ncbi:MAG: TIGR03663 family protein [Kiritimatiellales bacterium]|nr:TIGR03663 family protein [Kiritimatiellales bacterium]